MQVQLRQLSGTTVVVCNVHVASLPAAERASVGVHMAARVHLPSLVTCQYTQLDPLRPLVMIVQVKEVGDGNINYVYVLEGPAGSLCLKQGHPYVRIMKSWKLSQVCPSGEQELFTLVIHQDEIPRSNSRLCL